MARTARTAGTPGTPGSGTARTADRVLRRDVALVCLADGIVGVSFGATTVAGGLPWWLPIVMSLLVFAGGAQIAAVGVVLAGGSPVAAVAAGAVLNTRLFPYGLAVADVTAGSPGRLATRLFGAHLVTDESVAFTLRHTDQARRRAGFWTCGVSLFTAWNVAVALGVLAGSAMRNTAAFGLDATFPAVLLALALPTLTGRRTRLAAFGGAGAAVALTPLLPAGLPVLAALGGLAALWRPHRAGGRRWGRRREPGDGQRPEPAGGLRPGWQPAGRGLAPGAGRRTARGELPAGGDR
jgi:predicted branched-subunit amino acid permease